MGYSPIKWKCDSIIQIGWSNYFMERKRTPCLHFIYLCTQIGVYSNYEIKKITYRCKVQYVYVHKYIWFNKGWLHYVSFMAVWLLKTLFFCIPLFTVAFTAGFYIRQLLLQNRAVAPCWSILIRLFSAHWVRIFIRKQKSRRVDYTSYHIW